MCRAPVPVAQIPSPWALGVQIEDFRGSARPARHPDSDAVGFDDDGAVPVSPVDAGAGRLEAGQGLRRGMPEGVAGARGDDGEGGAGRVEERALEEKRLP